MRANEFHKIFLKAYQESLKFNFNSGSGKGIDEEPDVYLEVNGKEYEPEIFLHEGNICIKISKVEQLELFSE